MISDFLINVVYAFIQLIVLGFSALPDAELPAFISDGLDDVAPYYSAIDPIFPIGVILAILTIVEIPFLGALGFYYLFKWAYQKVPGIN